MVWIKIWHPSQLNVKLNILKYKYCTTHVIYHVTILLTILTDNLVVGLRKESSNNNFFSLIVNISNTSHLEFYYPLHLNKKLFKPSIFNFTYIYPKCKKVRYVYPLSE